MTEMRAFKIIGYYDREEWYEDEDGHWNHKFTKLRSTD
jgi:hypothetical protein